MPSTNDRNDTSSPVIYSSITTLAFVFVNSFSSIVSASVKVLQIVTPLPAQSPSALMTIGSPSCFMMTWLSFIVEQIPYLAVGIPYCVINCFAKDFDPSN